MSERNDGGPAFPTEQGHTPEGLWNQTYDPGMTLRDYFAAKAMQGVLSRGIYSANQASDLAYWYADAMLKAREE